MGYDRRTELAGLVRQCERLDRVDKQCKALDRKLLHTAKNLYKLTVSVTVAVDSDQLPTSLEQMRRAGHPADEGSRLDRAQQVIRQVQDSLAPESSQSEPD